LKDETYQLVSHSRPLVFSDFVQGNSIQTDVA
jgi:hypothetical protein